MSTVPPPNEEEKFHSFEDETLEEKQQREAQHREHVNNLLLPHINNYINRRIRHNPRFHLLDANGKQGMLDQWASEHQHLKKLIETRMDYILKEEDFEEVNGIRKRKKKPNT